MTIDKTKIENLLKKHSEATLTKRRLPLTRELLHTLGLEGTCTMASVLNSDLEEERSAARKMIEKNLDALLSNDPEEVKKTQEKIGDFYYCVESGAPNPA